MALYDIFYYWVIIKKNVIFLLGILRYHVPFQYSKDDQTIDKFLIQVV